MFGRTRYQCNGCGNRFFTQDSQSAQYCPYCLTQVGQQKPLSVDNGGKPYLIHIEKEPIFSVTAKAVIQRYKQKLEPLGWQLRKIQSRYPDGLPKWGVSSLIFQHESAFTAPSLQPHSNLELSPQIHADKDRYYEFLAKYAYEGLVVDKIDATFIGSGTQNPFFLYLHFIPAEEALKAPY